MSRINLNQAGDTIVEVMIASAVVGLVIVGAFRSANFSAGAVQRAKERAEAVKVTESQIELIRDAVIAGAPAVTGSDFCVWFDASPSVMESKRASAPSAECSFDALGSNPNGRYKVSVDESGGKYTISTTWDALGAGQIDSIVMYYSIGS